MPRPLQVNPVSVPAEQLVFPQPVPLAYSLQLWLPSQLPFFLHVSEPSSSHSPSGSVSDAIAPQVPSTPVPFLLAEQASHVPAQAVSQQKPSMQWPLVHCEADVQLLPLAWSGWHEVSELRQYAEAMQLLSEAHDAAQELPEHVYGEHAVTFEGSQEPNPSHE